MAKLFIFTDGGARGNPGPAAVGAVIKNEKGEIIAQLSRRIGKATNNVAEYSAVVEALKWLKDNVAKKRCGNETALGNSLFVPKPMISSTSDESSAQVIQFFLDSKLVVNQLNGFFKVKNASLRDLLVKIRILEQEIGGNIVYRLVPREENRQADALVNRALDGLNIGIGY